eukprot:TRINITY_DN8871_c0_g2_i1.p1 TRINITY_DN8871_c0_g2~~TRINITY_DN8871_c0_g2_i1.p1  ORF type:complete len:458 (-),score=114.31 TRINITY_DN8871_c0_g2_i1:623-1900(-)
MKVALARRQHIALEGQLIQETVLADELEATEARQTAKLRELEAAVAARAHEDAVLESGAREQAARAKREAAQTVEAVQESRSICEQLAQRASLLRAEQVETEAVPPASLRQHVASLETEEQHLAEQARFRRHEEREASENIQKLREKVLDLSADCGVLLLSTGEDQLQNSEEAFFQQLRRTLPAEHRARRETSLSAMLEVLESERDTVAAVLSGHEDPQLRAARHETEELARQLARLEEEALQKTRRLQRVTAEARLAGEALASIDDRLAEAAALRKENELLTRQQAEWRRSESRMLQLAEGLQCEHNKGTHSQALLAARMVDLQREMLAPAAGKDRGGIDCTMQERSPAVGGQDRERSRVQQQHSFRLVLRGNEELKQRIRSMEEERDKLVQETCGLAQTLARMPDIEAKLSEDSPLSHYPPSP